MGGRMRGREMGGEHDAAKETNIKLRFVCYG